MQKCLKGKYLLIQLHEAHQVDINASLNIIEDRMARNSRKLNESNDIYGNTSTAEGNSQPLFIALMFQ